MAHKATSSCPARPDSRSGGVFSRVLPRFAGAARFFVGALKDSQRTHNKALLVSATGSAPPSFTDF